MSEHQECSKVALRSCSYRKFWSQSIREVSNYISIEWLGFGVAPFRPQHIRKIVDVPRDIGVMRPINGRADGDGSLVVSLRFAMTANRAEKIPQIVEKVRHIAAFPQVGSIHDFDGFAVECFGLCLATNMVQQICKTI